MFPFMWAGWLICLNMSDQTGGRAKHMLPMRLVRHIDPVSIDSSSFCLRCHTIMRQKAFYGTRQTHRRIFSLKSPPHMKPYILLAPSTTCMLC